MYRNSTPPSPPYTIEEEDGNCVIVAPLGSAVATSRTSPLHRRTSVSHRHAAYYGLQVDPPSAHPAYTSQHPPSSSAAQHPLRQLQQQQQQQPLLVSTPRSRDRPEASVVSPHAVNQEGRRSTPATAAIASSLVYAVRRSASGSRPREAAATNDSTEGMVVPVSAAAAAEVASGEPEVGERAVRPLSSSRAVGDKPPLLPPSPAPAAAANMSTTWADPTVTPTVPTDRTLSSNAPPSTHALSTGVMYKAIHGPGVLGPLILVAKKRTRPSARGGEGKSVSPALLPPPDEAGALAVVAPAMTEQGANGDVIGPRVGGEGLVTWQEAQSYRTELAALRARLEAAGEALREAERRTDAIAASKAQALADERRREERQRRAQMQHALDSLRDQCAELTAQLEAARVHRPGHNTVSWSPSTAGEGGDRGDRNALASCSTATASPALQAEWGRQLQEVESYWRQRLRAATRHWESELEAQGKDRAALRESTRELSRALEHSQEALRRTMAEKQAVEAECARLRELPVGIGGSHKEASVPGGRVLDENTKLRLRVKEQDRRQEALLTQIESYAEENTRLQVEHEAKMKAVKQELEKERARNADLIQLYSSQVQSLHQQLNDAVAQRNSMAAQLKQQR